MDADLLETTSDKMLSASENSDRSEEETEVACVSDVNHEAAHLKTIFVGNLSFYSRHSRMKKFFSKFGKVEHISIIEDHVKKTSKGIAFIRFENAKSVDKALSASEDERKFEDRILRIFPAKEKRLNLLRKEVKKLDIKKSDGYSTDADNVPIESPICILNDDILLTIFSYLNMEELLKLDFVCRKWEILALRTWAAMHTLNFNECFCFFGVEPLTDEIFKKILARSGAIVRKINTIGAGSLLTYKSVEIIGELCPNLEVLSLTGSEVTDTGLKNMAIRCKKLKQISLPRCPNISDDGLKKVFQELPNLEYVDLNGNNLNITGSCFYRVGPNITKLCLDSCRKLESNGVQAIALNCRQLVELVITQCFDLDEAALLSLCTSCKELRKLNISGETIENNSFHIIGKLSKLEELNLSKNTTIQDKDIDAISLGCRELRSLDISGCCFVTDNAILNLCRCLKLTHLDLSNLSQLSDTSLVPLAMAGRLEWLKIRMCYLVSFNVCEALFTNCTRLILLDLSGCEGVTDTMSDSLAMAMSSRTNGLSLHISIGGTQARKTKSTVSHPLLSIDESYIPPVDYGLFEDSFSSSDDQDYMDEQDYMDDFYDDEAIEEDVWE